MKIITLALVLLGALGTSRAQLLSGQAKSSATTSTLVFPGSTVGLSFAEGGEVAFSYVTPPPRPCAKIPVFAGGWLGAKNQNGVGAVFDRGRFSPSAKLTFVTGLSFNLREKYSEAECKTVTADELRANLGQKLAVEEYDAIRIQSENISDPTERKAFADSVEAIFQDSTEGEFPLSLAKMANDSTRTFFIPKYRSLLINLRRDILALKAKYWDEIANAKRTAAEEAYSFAALRTKTSSQLKIFGLLRQSAAEYFTFDTINRAAPAQSFTKQYYSRADVGIGANYRLGTKLWLGVAYGWRVGNTIDLLRKDDYVLTTTTATATQKVVQEKKRTAYQSTYQGGYQEFRQSFLHADALFYLKAPTKLNGSSVLLNPYFRYEISRQKEVFPEITTLGLSVLYRSKSKFILGLYLEGFDLANNLTSFRSELAPQAPELLPIHNRLSFGILTQYEIVSIFQ